MAEVSSKRRVRIDDFARFQYVGALRVAEQGARLVYSLSTVNMEKNRYEADLWTLDTASGQTRRLTSSGKEGAFDLLDDGSVLFVSGRGKADAAKPAAGAGAQKPAAGELPAECDVVAPGFEKEPAKLAEDAAQGTDLYRIALDGGEAELFAHVPLTVLGWEQLTDRRFLLVARDLIDSAAPYATVVDIPFWENGGTYKSGLREGIYLLDLDAEDPAPQLLTAAGESVHGWVLSEDRATLYFTSSTFSTRAPLTSKVRALDVATLQVRDMDAPEMRYAGIEQLGAHALVLVGTDMKAHGINEDPQIFALDVNTADAACTGSNFRRISHDDFDVDFFNMVGSDCRRGHGQTGLGVGGAYLFAHSHLDDSWLSRIDATGEVTPLVSEDGSVECFDTLDGRTLYYVAMRPGKLAEICRRTVAQDGTVGAEEQLTHYSDALEGLDLVEPEAFDFESNGDTLRGYVMAPAGHEPGTKAPGVLWVHGGPKTTLGTLLFHEMQYLCGLGYYVFYTNPHGSGGHGIKFADIRGHYGDVDFDDLMNFTDEVLRRYPDMDAERLAEMGGSYGGFMTNWVIGHTDRFRCTNSQRSISNWVSMFGVADIGYYFADDQTAGWPWGCDGEGRPSVEKMWDQSPLKYADRVKTPTLFLHSDEDYRCPLEQGMQMFTALQLHDVPARLVVFKGENHELSRGGKPQARVRRLAEIANWYAQWLKDDPAGEPTLRAGAVAE